MRPRIVTMQGSIGGERPQKGTEDERITGTPHEIVVVVFLAVRRVLDGNQPIVRVPCVCPFAVGGHVPVAVVRRCDGRVRDGRVLVHHIQSFVIVHA